MGFDIQNFGIGVIAGWASAYGVYRYRHVVKGIVDSMRSQASTAQNAATRSADSRLMGDLIRRCETSHMAGSFIKLTDILIEPRFLPASEIAAPSDDDVLEDVFHVVPRIHDLPYLHGPFNVPSLTIADLDDGPRALALLGLPGSGRTTALHSIALYSLNRLRFQVQADTVNALIEEEEAKLPEKERAQRRQERQKMEALAREKFAEERGTTFETDAEATLQSVHIFNRLMPLYCSFDAFDFGAFEQGDVDPAEPLVKAVQATVGRITRMTMVANLYRRLSAGHVLVLLDGLDDLPDAQQQQALAWLKAFMAAYGENFVIVAGPARGYAPLMQLGLTPVFMRPWQDYDVAQAFKQWTAALSRVSNKKLGSRKAGDEAVQTARMGVRALTPAELTLKIWSTLSTDAPPQSPLEWYAPLTARLTDDKTMAKEDSQVLSRLAWLELEDGVITPERMMELGIAIPKAPPAAQAAAPEAELREAVNPEQPDVSRTTTTQEVLAATAKRLQNRQAKLLRALHKSGMLVRCGESRYRFRNPHFTAYYASFAIGDLDAPTWLRNSPAPLLQQTIACAAMHSTVDDFVRAKLEMTGDISQSGLLDISAWLRNAPTDIPWRGTVLKSLANLILMPNQYPSLRERAAAALVGTADSSTLFILRRAARNQNPSVRRLACLAMGALGDPAAIDDLSSLVQDAESEVQLAAAMALGAVATEQALEAMVIAFTQDSEPVRKAIAEAFAGLPEHGHPILYDANRDSDMLLRRCSIAGIRRIRAGWALAAIYRTFLEDSEWYVKSAAEAAFAEMDTAAASRLTATPSPAEIAWVQHWMQQRGEELSVEDPTLPLRKALQDKEPGTRALAATALGEIGALDGMTALYEALLDAHDDVRGAVHQALTALQVQLGRPLPAPRA